MLFCTLTVEFLQTLSELDISLGLLVNFERQKASFGEDGIVPLLVLVLDASNYFSFGLVSLRHANDLVHLVVRHQDLVFHLQNFLLVPHRLTSFQKSTSDLGGNQIRTLRIHIGSRRTIAIVVGALRPPIFFRVVRYLHPCVEPVLGYGHARVQLLKHHLSFD